MEKNANAKVDLALVLDKAPSRPTAFIYVVTVLSAVGGFLFGYDTGVVSGAIILLRDYFSLNYLMQEVVVSVTIVAAWMFALISGFATDKCGRKPIIIFASFVFTLGALLMALAVTKVELIVGRFIVGAGIGLASMVVPVYIAEVAPAEIRGRLVTINNCCITFGQLVASVVDGIFSYDAIKGWRYMLGLAAVPSVIQFFGFLFMPESPRWLIQKKKYEEASTILCDIRGGDKNRASEEFEAVKLNCEEIEREQLERNDNSLVIIQVLKNPSLRRALLVGCSLQIFQQLAGINTVMYYSATIIQMSGVKDNTKVIWLSCATAGMNCICSFAAFFFVERSGRRILTLVSLGGVVFSLLFLGGAFQLVAANSPGVTLMSNNVTEGHCATFSNCAGCVTNEYCGFCFEETPYGPANGTCLKVDMDRPEYSLHGICSNHTSSDIAWAHNWCPSPYSWLTFFGLLLYLFCFAPGMGSTPWTINSEIYPMWARSTCFSAATSFNWLLNFVVSLTFLTLTQALTKYGTFYLYACISAVGFVFFLFMLPETRGKSLEEVEALFAHPYYKEMCGERKTVQSSKKDKDFEASIAAVKRMSLVRDAIEF